MRYTRRAALAFGGALALGRQAPFRATQPMGPASPTPRPRSLADEASVHVYRGGPTHHGHQPGPIPETPPEVLWSFGTSAPLTCSPLLDAETGTIVTGGPVGAMFGIDRATGRLRWAAPLDSEPRSTGLIADGRLIYIDTSPHALNVADGTEIPYFEDQENLILSSLTVADGIIYSGGRRWDVGFMDARDLGTGEILWRFDLELGVQAAPIVADGIVASGAIGPTLVGLAAETGRARWRLPGTGRTLAAPCAAHGLMYVPMMSSLVTQSSSTVVTDFVVAVDLQLGEPRWRIAVPAPAETSPALLSDMVLVSGGPRLLACDALSGQERWRYVAQSNISASPVVIGERILIGCDDGALSLLDATGTEIWRVALNERVTGSPIVTGDQIFVTANGTLHALGRPVTT